MARFYATAQGQSGETSRIGTTRSGIVAHVRGWNVGVRVAGGDDDGRDSFDIYATYGSNGAGSSQLLGTVTTDDDGTVVFHPAESLVA